MVYIAKRGMIEMNEGNLKWTEFHRNTAMMNQSTRGKHVPLGIVNSDCNFIPVINRVRLTWRGEFLSLTLNIRSPAE